MCQDNRQTDGRDHDASGKEDAQLCAGTGRRIKAVCESTSENSGHRGQHVEKQDKHRPPVAVIETLTLLFLEGSYSPSPVNCTGSSGFKSYTSNIN